MARINAIVRNLVWVIGAMAAGPVRHFSREDRYAGLKEVADAAGCSLRTIHLPQLTEPFGLEAYGDILRPDVGVVTYDAVQSQRLMNTAAMAGLRAGTDFGLVCCDRTHHSQITWPGLSCVAVDRFRLGEAAAQMMLDILAERPCPSREIHGQWVEGTTIGAAEERK